MIQIAVLGYGTVGSGVFEVLHSNRDVISSRAGEEINVKYVLDLREFPGDPVESVLVHDFDVIVNDPEVSIVVEVMGGLSPAYEFTRRALEAGKSVCTSNKALVEKHGAELMATARDNNVNYLFEASVGGGIPIIRPLKTSLTADEIVEITGILNGTTNYILTKMSTEGSDFNDVLKAAQEKGYAELNPEADVEGYDASRKIAILTSLVSGYQVDFEDIYTEGITGVTPEDFRYAKLMHRAVKLLGVSRKENGKYSVMVAPFLIDERNPLFNVNGVFNAISVVGNMLGEVMFYGSGAGKLPTASAVVSDVVEAAVHPGENVMFSWSTEKLELKDIGESRKRFFVRAKGEALSELKRMKEIFGEAEPVEAGIEGEFGFVTAECTEAEFDERAKEAGNIIGRIRMEG